MWRSGGSSVWGLLPNLMQLILLHFPPYKEGLLLKNILVKLPINYASTVKMNHAHVFYFLISNLNDAWTTEEPLYYVCAAWPFVNINIFLTGVVKVPLNVSTAQQLASPPWARIIYEFKESAWDWHTVADEVVIRFIWTQARTEFLFRCSNSSTS